MFPKTGTRKEWWYSQRVCLGHSKPKLAPWLMVPQIEPKARQWHLITHVGMVAKAGGVFGGADLPLRSWHSKQVLSIGGVLQGPSKPLSSPKLQEIKPSKDSVDLPTLLGLPHGVGHWASWGLPQEALAMSPLNLQVGMLVLIPPPKKNFLVFWPKGQLFANFSCQCLWYLWHTSAKHRRPSGYAHHTDILLAACWCWHAFYSFPLLKPFAEDPPWRPLLRPFAENLLWRPLLKAEAVCWRSSGKTFAESLCWRCASSLLMLKWQHIHHQHL